MSEKRFDDWNTKKKEIDGNDIVPYFHTRQIWFVRLGENIGYEQAGKGTEFLRPVIVYKKFSANVFLGIPLTSREKEGRFYYSFDFKEKKSVAILSQIRLFDTKRLDYLYGRLGEKTFLELKEKLIELIQ